MMVAACKDKNPFLSDWNTPYGIPPFDQIKTEDYIPAIKEGIEQNKKEMKVSWITLQQKTKSSVSKRLTGEEKFFTANCMTIRIQAEPATAAALWMSGKRRWRN